MSNWGGRPEGVQHHDKKTFRQEYIQFLTKYEIEHDERFIFKPLQ